MVKAGKVIQFLEVPSREIWWRLLIDVLGLLGSSLGWDIIRIRFGIRFSDCLNRIKIPRAKIPPSEGEVHNSARIEI